jgi:hypothetical protein
MNVVKWLALAGTIALSGCCVSGNGCYAPVPGAPVAWDGLGAPPSPSGFGSGAGDEPVEPRRKPRRNHEIVVGPLNGTVRSGDSQAVPSDRWEREQAANRADEARLAKKLMICRDCSTAPARDEESGRTIR